MIDQLTRLVASRRVHAVAMLALIAALAGGVLTSGDGAAAAARLAAEQKSYQRPAPRPPVVIPAIAVPTKTSVRVRKLGRRGVRITRFTVTAPATALITISCKPSRACPRQSVNGRGVARSFSRMVGRRFRNGSSWTVTVFHVGLVGVRTTYSVRNGNSRSRRTCLAAGSSTQTRACP